MQEPRSPTRQRWAVTCAVAVLVLLLVQLRTGLEIADRRIGVSYDPTATPVVLDNVDEGLPAARGGVREGDTLLAIDGQPVRNEADFDRMARGFERGRTVHLEVERQGRRVELAIQPGAPFAVGDFALNAIACLLYLALGLLASRQRIDDLRSTLLAGFCLAVSFELALPYLLLPTDTLAGAAAMVGYYLVTGLQFGLDLHLATVLPATPAWLKRWRWVVPSYYVIGLAVGSVAAVTSVLVALERLPYEPYGEWTDFLVFYVLLPVWAFAIAGIIGRRALRYPEPRGRMQAGLVLLGVLPWVAVVLVDSGLGLLSEYSSFLPTAEPLSDAVWNYALLAYPLAVFVAIFRYQLFDLELVVRKSLLYGGLTTILVLGFFGVVAATGSIFARQFGSEGVPLWVLSSAGVAMGLLFNPLRGRLQRLIDRRLFPERLALRTRLIGLAAELPAQGKLPRMGEHLARELARIFAVDPVTVWIAVPPQGQLLELASTRPPSDDDPELTALIGGEDKAVQLLERARRPLPASLLERESAALAARLRRGRAELVVPLIAQERLSGLLAIGPKRESSRFVAEELELLLLVGHHAATVFENARLFDSATFEGLTGLYRREALLEILDREWSRSERYDRPLAIALADIDHFKSVNDRYGHLSGDLVLQAVAAALRAELRETDFIGRFGGEEFLVLLPETTLDGARRFAEKARQAVAALEVPIEGGGRVSVTVSFGVAARGAGPRAEGRGRSRTLIAAADEALYAAKSNGRNRVEAAVES